MKKFAVNYGSLIIALTIIMSLGFPKQGNTQENNNRFGLVDLMKVEQGNDEEYLDMESKLWKPIHQERVKNGKIAGWILYRVWYKGANDDYNYVTVTLFDNLANLEDPFEGIELAEIHPGMERDEFMEKTNSSRKLVQSRLIQRVNFAYPDGGQSAAPFKYLVVNYMKPVSGSAFLELENEKAKPIHEELVKSGEWAGWSVWANVFPRGTNEPHQFATVDYYSDFSKLGTADYMGAFEKAHPDEDWDNYTSTLQKARDIVLSELWEVVDMVIRE